MEPKSDLETTAGFMALKEIIGARLTSVQFVLDYLILGFDAKGALTTLVWPEIFKGNDVCRLGNSDYRNRLCGLITQVVVYVEINPDETFKINFDNGTRVEIPLKTYSLPGERAIFTTPKRKLHVW